MLDTNVGVFLITITGSVVGQLKKTYSLASDPRLYQCPNPIVSESKQLKKR